MSEMYRSLLQSLTEEVNDIKKFGRPMGRRTTLEIKPVKHYSAAEARAVRIRTGVSQAVFAKAMGVSKKTVEAGESGVNTPSGSASRMLALFDDNSISIDHYIIR